MSLITRSISQIEIGKDLDASLTSYADRLALTAGRLSALRFAMNVDIMYESVQAALSDGAIPEADLTILSRIAEIGEEVIARGPVSGDRRAELLTEIKAMRDRQTDRTQELFLLSDRIVSTEYIMNRREAAILPEKMKSADQLKGDTETVNALMSFILGNRDLQQIRMKDIIAQLPLRMTSAKFFQILENGLSVYQESEKEMLDRLVDEIRCLSGLKKTPDFQENLSAELQLLQDAEDNALNSANASAFRSYRESLEKTAESTQFLIEHAASIQELVNDLYVCILAGPKMLMEAEEKEALGNIVRTVSEKAAGGFREELPENLAESFEVMEGRQEAFYTEYYEGSTSLPQILEERSAKIESLGLTEDFRELNMITRMLSDSRFASLEEEAGSHELCGRSGVNRVYAELLRELEPALKAMPRMKKRAVMAQILNVLPPFLLTSEDLRDYISNALNSCTDLAEKTGCLELLDMIMSGELE